MKKVLIVVDYQKDFASPNGALYVHEAETIADKIQKEIDNPIYDTVIYTMDTHMPSDYEKSEEAKMFPIHCVYGTDGWGFFNIKPRNKEIEEKMTFNSCPRDVKFKDEIVFTKDVFDIWEGNINYENFIRRFDKDTEFYIVGVATNFCVKSNAIGYSNIGYKNIFILEEATKGIPTDDFYEVVEDMKNKGIKFIGGQDNV